MSIKSFDDVKPGTTWRQILKDFDPEIDTDNDDPEIDDSCNLIYEIFEKEAYRVAVLSRRDYLTDRMVFDCMAHYYHFGNQYVLEAKINKIKRNHEQLSKGHSVGSESI